MRVTQLVLVAALYMSTSVLLGTGVADAEKVRTNQSTKLMARPGEQAKVLLTVKSGQNMKLLAKDGRWLKVRVQGRTGYVPRSKVDMADDEGIARNTRRRPFVDGRSKRRGFGGSAPDDRVGADAVGDGAGDDEEPEDEEEEEDEPAPKKAVARSKKGEDEEEDEEEEEDEPAPRKATTKTAAATKSKGGESEDEEEEDEAADDEDDEGDSKAASAGDDEDPVGDDEEEDTEQRKTARVTKKVTAYIDPDPDSDEEFIARPTDILYPIETEGAWTYVENAEGDGGWIQNDMLEIDGGAGGPAGKRAIDVRARMGIAILQQGMRTAGSNVLTVPDNYNIGTSAVTLSLGAGLLMPRGKKLVVGGEFTYDFGKTLLGGITYDPDTTDSQPGVNIGITLHNVNLRGLVGIDLKKKSGMMLLGRLGYRYQGFLIGNVESMTANPARLPSEVVKGPTLGAAFMLPRLTEKIGLKFSLDTMLFGASVTQTKGIEDGTSPSVMAVVVGTGLTYKFKKSFDLAVAYDLSYMGIDFGAPAQSMRMHMGTNVKRTDIFHMVSFGIAKPF